MKFRNPFKRETRDADPSWAAMQGLAASGIGASVTGRSAEGIAAVYACVQILSESVACLPLHVYAVDADGDRVRADDHPLAAVLREPNEYSSGMTLRESMTAEMLLTGNSYAKRVYNRAGELVELLPIPSGGVNVSRLPNGRIAYDFTWPITGERERLFEDEVFHLSDRRDPGAIVGKSRIAIAREALGAIMAQRNLGANMYRNALSVGGFFVPEQNLNQEQMGQFNVRMRTYTQPENAGKYMMLLKGMEYVNAPKLSMTDAQWVESQQFSIEEVARLFRVSPVMLHDLRNANYSNAVELGAQFVRYSLQRHLTMWEAEISRQLLGPIARRRYKAEHNVDALMRADADKRAEFYEKMLGIGAMTVDEVRKLENLPALQRSQAPS